MRHSTLPRLLGLTAAGLLAAAVTVPAHAQREGTERVERRDRVTIAEHIRERADQGERAERRERAEQRQERERPAAWGAPAADGGFLGTPFWERPAVAERLELTDEQKTALKNSREEMLEALEEAHEATRAAGQALRSEVAKDKPSHGDVNQLVDEYFASRAEDRKIVLEHVLNVKDVLTGEQAEALESMARRLAAAQPEPPARPERPRAEAPERPAPPREDAPRARMEEHRELMGQIRATLAEGGDADDVMKLLEEADLDDQARERIVRMIERWSERDADAPRMQRPGMGERGPAGERPERPERRRP